MEMESIVKSKWTRIWSEDDSVWVFTTRQKQCYVHCPIPDRFQGVAWTDFEEVYCAGAW